MRFGSGKVADTQGYLTRTATRAQQVEIDSRFLDQLRGRQPFDHYQSRAVAVRLRHLADEQLAEPLLESSLESHKASHWRLFDLKARQAEDLAVTGGNNWEMFAADEATLRAQGIRVTDADIAAMQRATPLFVPKPMSTDTTEHSHRGAWIAALAMVAIGGLMVAGQRFDREWLKIGWLLVLGSAFPVKFLGKKLLLYIPAAYVTGLFIAFAFVLPVNRFLDRAQAEAQCPGYPNYALTMADGIEQLNQNIEATNTGVGTPSWDRAMDKAIGDTAAFYQDMQAMSVPSDAVAQAAAPHG